MLEASCSLSRVHCSPVYIAAASPRAPLALHFRDDHSRNEHCLAEYSLAEQGQHA